MPMSPFTALLVAAVASAGARESASQGAQVESARVQAEIVRAVIVRQASGLQPDRDAPAPQITRRGRTVLVEFQ